MLIDICLRRTDNGRTTLSRRGTLCRRTAYRSLLTFWHFTNRIIIIIIISPRYNTDCWPLTFKHFSNASSHDEYYVPTIIESHPLSRDFASREIGVNGRTAGRTTRKHNASRCLFANGAGHQHQFACRRPVKLRCYCVSVNCERR